MRKPNTKCKDCEKPLYRKLSESNKWQNTYCNDCKKNHMGEFAKIKNDNDYNNFIENWKQGLVNGMRGEYSVSQHIIRFLRCKYNNKCAKCGWCEINIHTNKVPLEVEHIDGNYKNNCENNLILLCPNCHSLTSTYKGANRGNGRKKRKKYA